MLSVTTHTDVLRKSPLSPPNQVASDFLEQSSRWGAILAINGALPQHAHRHRVTFEGSCHIAVQDTKTYKTNLPNVVF